MMPKRLAQQIRPSWANKLYDRRSMAVQFEFCLEILVSLSTGIYCVVWRNCKAMAFIRSIPYCLLPLRVSLQNFPLYTKQAFAIISL